MKLNLTIELPLKNPEEILDMTKINKILDSNFVNSLNDQQAAQQLTHNNLDEFTQEAFFTASIVDKLSSDINDLTASMKSEFPEKVDYDIQLPDALVSEYPDIPIHWNTVKNKYNSLHERVFGMCKVVEQLVNNSHLLGSLVTELARNGLPQFNELNSEISNLTEKMSKIEVESKKAIKENKDVSDLKVEKYRLQIHDKDKLMNQKDAMNFKLEKEMSLITEELKVTKSVLTETSSQVSNKYQDFQELNKYISELFKDKNKMLLLMDEKDNFIAKLQNEIEEFKKTVQTNEKKDKNNNKSDLVGLKLLNETFAKRIDELEKEVVGKEEIDFKKKSNLAESRLMAETNLDYSKVNDSRFLKEMSVLYKEKVADWIQLSGNSNLQQSIIEKDA